jgi:hypothetical protein
MNEKAIKAEMRLYAVESVVSTLVALECLKIDSSNPLQFFEALRKSMIDGARRQTFPQLDPAKSDLFSAELEDAASRLAAMVRDQIALILKANN